jgi:para-nitrobenzyl esterase
VSLIVETLAGKVAGALRGDVAIWKGIPYAAPPTGGRRFRPPEPAAAWPGVRDATRYGPVAAQSREPRIAMMSGVTDKVASGEDCLTLNVFAPAPGFGGGKHPVMVWVHGGAFIMGSGSTPLYDGGSFAAEGVVVVTLNYRLGLPGLLYLGDLAPGRAEGNYALLDQVAALRWVAANIAGFGGDPDAVTVMGESAGAISIASLLAMPAARGLFHRAILQSGASALWPTSRADATGLARRVLGELGCTVGQLAELPIERVLEVQARISEGIGVGSLAPYIDEATLPAAPLELIRAGAAAGIPLLLGTNRDEWTLFEVFLGEVTIDAFKAPLRARLGSRIEPLLDAYRADRADRSDRLAWLDLVGDTVFRIPMIRLAEAQAALGAPVYAYRFDWRSPAFGGRLGAGHALELPFVWNRLDLPVSQILIGADAPRSQALATAVHATWVEFIKTGEPNRGGLPAWPPYEATRRATLRIDRESEVVDDPGGAARALWSAILPA